MGSWVCRIENLSTRHLLAWLLAWFTVLTVLIVAPALMVLAGTKSDPNVRKSVEVVEYPGPEGTPHQAVFACFSNTKGMGGTAMDCHRLR